MTLSLRFFAAVLPLDDPLPLRDPDEPDELDVLFAVVALLRAFSSAIATACFCAFFFDDGRLFPIDPDFS